MIRWFTDPLLDLVFPEECVLCGSRRGEKTWSAAGPPTPGLRFWDTTHLCLSCETGLETCPVSGELARDRSGGLPVVAAAKTNADLVRLVGRFKYHGQRGLAWPLARMLHGAFVEGAKRFGPVEAVVPVALHGRRRRVRGFNQADVLAHGLQPLTGIPVRCRTLARKRGTDQQAKLKTAGDRRRNLEGAFVARPPADGRPSGSGKVRPVCLVDDLVTSGWTVLSAAAALEAAGWRVAWVLSLGLSSEVKNPRRRVDTRDGGF